jgi:hypothetical protein
MSLKSDVFKQKLKHKGHWNYKEFYEISMEVLKDMGYGVGESEYSEKTGTDGKEIKFDWNAEKKITDYFKGTMSIKVRIRGLKDVEVEQEGKKINTYKGEMSIEVKAALEKDYEDRWEQQPFWKMMRGVYEKYVIRTTVDEYEDKVAEDAANFVGQIKSFLQIS